MRYLTISEQLKQRIESDVLAEVVDAYASATARGAKEPVITAGTIADDWMANYPAVRFEYIDRESLRYHVNLALKRLEAAGKVEGSQAMKGNREVRAYNPK